MLLPEADIDWEKFTSIKTYSDPNWMKEETRYELALRMWQGGMLTFVTRIRSSVKVFTVVKKMETSETGEARVHSSRLVWDCRQVNCLFKQPPWVPLGSPAWKREGAAVSSHMQRRFGMTIGFPARGMRGSGSSFA